MADAAQPDFLWLTENDVVEAVSLNEAIDALHEGLTSLARGEAANVDKAFATWGQRSSMHALGSLMPHKGFVGFKTWVNTPGGAAAIFSLFDAGDGSLVAMIEAAALGQMRTSAISGLATRALAEPGADEMALIGTGAQALMQVAAVASVQPLRRLRVHSPTAEKRAAFVQRAQTAFPFEVVDCPTIEAAVEGAPIVTLITRAKAPFLSGRHLAKGAHLNAAGAILPGYAEFDQDVFPRAVMLVVDSLANAVAGSAEFRERFGVDKAAWTSVTTLGEVLVEGRARAADDDLTVFKPMGMGISDLSVAVAVLQKAKAQGIGTQMTKGRRSPPRWTAFDSPGRAA